MEEARTGLFGKLPAFAYGWLAGLLGTTAIFLLVRSVARAYVQRTLGARSERLRALDEWVTRNGFVAVLVLRLVWTVAELIAAGVCRFTVGTSSVSKGKSP